MKKLYNNLGYTIIEVIIVIIILGIISSIVLINWSYSSMNLDAQTSLMISDIRYTQNLSVSKNERCRFVINRSDKSYEIRNSSNVNEPMPNGNTKQSLSHDTNFGSLTNITNTIIFDGKGVPYTDTTTPESPLSTNATITLQTDEGKTKTVTIIPETGKISI